MFVSLLIVHVVICLVLIVAILMQSGRGEGLSGTFGAGFTQTLFGTASATFLTRVTMVAGALFMISSLGLAFISGSQYGSIMEQRKAALKPVKSEKPAETVPGAEPAEGTKETAEAVPAKPTEENAQETAKTVPAEPIEVTAPVGQDQGAAPAVTGEVSQTKAEEKK